MLHIEIAQGKSSYKPYGDYETAASAHEEWSSLKLSEGARARLLDDEQGVIDRIKYEEQQAALAAPDAYEDEAPYGEVVGRDIPLYDIPTDPNYALINHQTGVVPLAGKSRAEAWETAIDAVNYPVHIVAGFYKIDGEYVRAEGTTIIGRPTGFNFVVVDKLRSGTYNPIATVTDRYGSMPAPSVYADLQQCLDKTTTGYRPREVYVRGDGGAQELVIECQSKALVDEDDLRLLLVLTTSSDGTTTHHMTLSVWQKKRKFRMPVPAITQKLEARHTQTLMERTIDFAPSVQAMITAWNDDIVPLLHFFADCTLDERIALEELDRVAKEVGFGTNHRSALVQSYKEGEIKTSEKNSLYQVYTALSQYTEEAATSRESADRWRDKISKSMDRDLSRYRSKRQKTAA